MLDKIKENDQLRILLIQKITAKHKDASPLEIYEATRKIVNHIYIITNKLQLIINSVELFLEIPQKNKFYEIFNIQRKNVVLIKRAKYVDLYCLDIYWYILIKFWESFSECVLNEEDIQPTFSELVIENTINLLTAKQKARFLIIISNISYLIKETIQQTLFLIHLIKSKFPPSVQKDIFDQIRFKLKWIDQFDSIYLYYLKDINSYKEGLNGCLY